MKTMHPIATPGQPALKMKGFIHIVDDGVCADHGYLIPKSAAVALKSVSNSGIGVVDVPAADLRKTLMDLSARQKKRLAALHF